MSESGISILIPVYNHDVNELVNSLSYQAEELGIPYEIRCYDDFSEQNFRKQNKEIEKRPNTIYVNLPQNIGRSKIRNKLAKESKFNQLLFIDCDSHIVNEQYLKNYLTADKKHKVIVGGTIYTKSFNPKYSLRLAYGKEREEKSAGVRMKSPYQHINLNNIFLYKEIYLQNILDESIATYGHEDTKFGYSLKKKNILINHLDNPVEHAGLETNPEFLKKTTEGIKNFLKITNEGYGLESKLYKSFSFIKKYKLDNLFNFYYYLQKNNIKKNLLSEHPSLFYFDLFKLKLLLDQDKNSLKKNL
jgi:hypothetical protein